VGDSLRGAAAISDRTRAGQAMRGISRKGITYADMARFLRGSIPIARSTLRQRQATQGYKIDFKDIDPMGKSWELTLRGWRSHGLTYARDSRVQSHAAVHRNKLCDSRAALVARAIAGGWTLTAPRQGQLSGTEKLEPLPIKCTRSVNTHDTASSINEHGIEHWNCRFPFASSCRLRDGPSSKLGRNGTSLPSQAGAHH
jgi:hypothetical protein